jgi:hypothetical protein
MSSSNISETRNHNGRPTVVYCQNECYDCEGYTTDPLAILNACLGEDPEEYEYTCEWCDGSHF